MNSIVIRAEGLSKQYTIGKREAPYDTFREMVLRQVTAPLRWIQNRGNNQANGSRIWALKDVSFEVKPGEVIGIIGRNGAGKTTLLKILSRITDPTKGFAEIRGRVASLLSVGTGFHPELTGRENIYLNGTILGMRKGEIARKFDEIVSFAEIEKFMDTPVKRYSSGMYVRLAFAIAAHLNPEILLVDEVLAVGDVQFQKKCLGKMHDVASEGRTILFVSHNMAAVQRLCSRAIWLEGGSLLREGPTSDVTRRFVQHGLKSNGERVWNDIHAAPGNEVVRLRAIRVLDKTGAVRTDFTVREPVVLEMEFWVLKEGYTLDAAFDLYNEGGTALFAMVDNLDSPWKDRPRPTGIYKERCTAPGDFFNDGEISVAFAVVSNVHARVHAQIADAIGFTVVDNMDPSGVRGNYPRSWPAVAVRPRFHWTVDRLPLHEKISLLNENAP